MSPSFAELTSTTDSLQSLLVEIRRLLHRYPELSWRESKTAESIRTYLKRNGLPVSEYLAGTGFFTEIKGDRPGRTVAYRADMDALPIQDEKETEYASIIPGVGHMCGHDYHSTVALGVALTLDRYKSKFSGCVRVFWQPAEESTPSGAPKMISDGILDGVDAIFGIHCDPHLASGKVGIRNGSLTGSFDAFEISVKSPQSLHSARPHLGPDAMWIAHQIAQQLYALSTRITDSRSPSVISVCTFHGGDAVNVIPDHVRLSGTIRTSDADSRATLIEHIRKYCSHISDSHGVNVFCDILHGAPPVVNNEMLYNLVEATLKHELRSDEIVYPPQSMGAEDFAYYGELRPSFFMRVGTSSGPNTSYPLHSARFDVDETTLSSAVAIQTQLLLAYLNQ
jgi:amidohydrolase